MKKFIVSLAVILSFTAYAWRGLFGKLFHEPGGDDKLSNQSTSSGNSNTEAVLVPPDQFNANNDTNTSTPPADNNVNSTPPVTNGQYKNGKYTGPVTDAFYGPVQVRATISGGQITDVQFLQYPNDRQHSIEVSQYSMPILRSEALQAQSASVDIVSGATDTSYAFIQSLQSALAQAQ